MASWVTGLLLVAIIFVFAAQAVFFALQVRTQIFPDEDYHVILSQKYEQSLEIPENAEDTYWMGDISTKPFLYHGLMGSLLRLNVFECDDRQFLRLVNVVINCSTLLIVFLVARELFSSRWLRLLPVLLLAVLPQFVFMGGAVSYDSLVNLCASASILALVVILQRHSVRWSIVLAISLGIGLLVKFTMLPLAAVISVIWLISEVRYVRRTYRAQLAALWQRKSPRFILSLVLLVAVSAGVVHVYGRNLYTYHSPQPACEQVMAIELCRYSSLYVRDESLKASAPDEHMSPLVYPFAWMKIMLPQLFGISGHRQILPSAQALLPVAMAGVSILFLLMCSVKKMTKEIIVLGVIVLFYLLVLMYYQNYLTYVSTGNVFLSVQARYLFPIIAPAAMLVVYAISQIRRRSLAILFSILLVVCVGWMDVQVYTILHDDQVMRERFLTVQP